MQCKCGSHTIKELSEELEEYIKKDDSVIMVAEDGKIIAFAQCGLRYDYVEGTKSSPVGYLKITLRD